jgi:hypothetical protein
MRTIGALAVCTLALIIAVPAMAWMGEGDTTGVVIVATGDRVVVQADEGGQISFEPPKVKDGDQYVLDQAAVAQMKALKQGDKVSIHWGRDHTNHYYFVKLNTPSAMPGNARNGLAMGKVITTGEGRIVLALAEGGQLTLEPDAVPRGDKWVPDPDVLSFVSGLKAGDEVVSLWFLDGGTHYIMSGVARNSADGQGLGIVLAQAQMKQMSRQINQLQNQVKALQAQVQKLQAPAGN